MSAPIVSQNVEISSYETDLNARIKAVSLQNLLQELAYKGSDFCRCGPSVMREKKLFWALNRIHFRILDTPVWEDRLIMQTWSRGQIGPVWHRNFRIMRENAPDTPIVLATSAWTIVDTEERSILRGDMGFDPAFHHSEDTLPLCSKIVVPKELDFSLAGIHKVVWSDLDTNGHANNCAYTQWVMDSLPFDYVKGHRLADVEVNYYHEILFGEQVELHAAQSGNKWYVSGRIGEKICFVESLEFD